MPEFKDFKVEVLALYEDKKSRNKLDDLLANPSPANLRDYCLIKLSEEPPPTDMEVFQKFFNPFKKKESIEVAIKTFNTGSLRALQKFILGQTQNPDDLLVKLLSILVDYQPRPFQFGKENTPTTAEQSDGSGTATVAGDLRDGQDSQSEKSNTATGETNVTEDNGKKDRPVNEASSVAEKIPEATVPERPVEVSLRHYYKENKHVIRFSAAASITAAIFFTLYFLTPEECMCWNEEQYAVVDCQDKMQRHQVIGLDKNKLAFFRKITQPDTLGLKDVGYVWYSKIDNDVEFFTQPGLHPIKVDRSLKIATEHIITKYAGRKKNGTKQISETLADVEVQ